MGRWGANAPSTPPASSASPEAQWEELPAAFLIAGSNLGLSASGTKLPKQTQGENFPEGIAGGDGQGAPEGKTTLGLHKNCWIRAPAPAGFPFPFRKVLCVA